MSDILHIQSRDNPLVRMLARLTRDNTAYRREGLLWIEGEHLCQAALQRGLLPSHAVYALPVWQRLQPEWKSRGVKAVVLPERLYAEISDLESPPGMGFVLPLQRHESVLPELPTVVLDRIQDTGNTGSILRSAAAFGFRQVLALKGSAALWSPKVVRAGMGAHFALRLLESLDPGVLGSLNVPLLATSPQAGERLGSRPLPWPCAWVFGHEGQGVDAALGRRAHREIRIDLPGGEESLNVAACAAICLHASAASAAAPGP